MCIVCVYPTVSQLQDPAILAVIGPGEEGWHGCIGQFIARGGAPLVLIAWWGTGLIILTSTRPIAGHSPCQLQIVHTGGRIRGFSLTVLPPFISFLALAHGNMTLWI